MVDHTSPVGVNPGSVGLEDSESPFTRLNTTKTIAGNSRRADLSINQALEEGDLGNAYWLPDTE